MPIESTVRAAVRARRATSAPGVPGGAPDDAREPGRGAGTGAPPPRSPRVSQLLARADGELVAAQLTSQPWERYLHAHLAAMRAGAAVLAVRGAPGGRGAPRDVWGMLDRQAPELTAWSAYFAQGAALRSAAEAGRLEAVGAARATEAVAAAEVFVEAVRSLVDADDVGASSASGRWGARDRAS